MMTKTIEDLLTTVQVGRQTILEVSDGFENGENKRTIAFGERELNSEQPPEPQRAESPPRKHEFHSVDALVAYLEEYKSGNVVALADVSAGVVDVTLDENALSGREVLRLKPAVDPRVCDWVKNFNSQFRVSDFAKFVLAHRRQIVSPDPAEAVLVFSQVTANSTITMARGQGKSALNGVMVETKIGGGKTATQPMDIPDMLVIKSPIFVGGSAQEIEIDLLVGSNDPEDIYVQATSSDFVTKRIEAFEELLTELSTVDGLVCGLGRISYSDWEYLERE